MCMQYLPAQVGCLLLGWGSRAATVAIGRDCSRAPRCEAAEVGGAQVGEQALQLLRARGLERQPLVQRLGGQERQSLQPSRCACSSSMRRRHEPHAGSWRQPLVQHLLLLRDLLMCIVFETCAVA